MRSRQLALQADREELEKRIKATGINYYAAVGTLRVSSLQQGNGMLYRLPDPSTGRTLVYIRSGDPKIGAMVNQFIGVKGEITDDPQLNLKTISPTAFEAVDQSKVNINIAAQIVPPSLVNANGGTSQASTGNQ